jgi:hypothetical protein
MRRTKRTLRIFVLLAAAAAIMSGCMYSGEVKRMGAPASGEYIAVVQSAIDQYRSKTGVLPLKNREQNTPIYEKYLIDFRKLVDSRALATVPVNAFENGGTAIYVLVNPETKPEVKLLDLPAYNKLVEIQQEVDDYAAKHGGKLPEGTEISPHFHTVDFGKLGRKEEQIASPYSRTYLAVILDDSGKAGIDYGPEIAKAMDKQGVKSADPGTDLRTYLVQSGIFVPSRSFTYRWSSNGPVPSQQ